jgi:CheY-like chemotaxis protein/PAS domain-containing protein
MAFGQGATMSDAASFDAIMQCNLLEVFCEALGAAIIVTYKLDEVSFASVRLLHFFPISENAIAAGSRARDLYGALFDAGCRFGSAAGLKDKKREDWIAERVTSAWKERVDTIEQSGPDRWFRIVSRRFASGLGLTVIQDVSEHKKKELHWRTEQERVRMTEEILDQLPTAVAVKDRNLNFAAVNRQFCTMLKVPPEAVLGRSVWEIFEPGLAAALEEADWHQLSTGEDRQMIIRMNHSASDPEFILYRVRRIGRPGHHYLALTFDPIPMQDVASGTLAPADLVLRVGGEDRKLASDAEMVPPKAEDHLPEPARKVLYVNPRAAAATGIVSDAKVAGIELCVVGSERELAALLPAIHEAGLTLDLIAIDSHAGADYAAIASKHGIRHAVLPFGGNVMSGIVDVLEDRVTLQPVHLHQPQAAPKSEAHPEPEAGALDILAIEDNPVNQLALEQIFESLGLNFVLVKTGKDAVEKIKDIDPRMILADITLPDMPVTDLMPALEPLLRQKAARPPVIGLITSDSSEQRQIARSAGFIDAIAKPLSPDAIDLAIRKHVLHERSHETKNAKTAA